MPKPNPSIRPVLNCWQTKDGRKIRVHKMTNAHLMNAVLFLERRQKKAEGLHLFPDNDCFDIDCQDGCFFISESDRLYDALTAEVARRGLNIKQYAKEVKRL